MNKSRIEAFSDGVLAIILTIMVLELKVPHGSDLEALLPMCTVVVGYILSFVYVGIYWNNHHHLFHATRAIGGGVMWANLHLLFWLSLVPFVTGWVGEKPFTAWPSAAYGFVLLMAGVAYLILQKAIIARNGGSSSEVARAIGVDVKGKGSAVGYILGIGISFVVPVAAYVVYALIAAWWLVPDRRIEAQLRQDAA